MKNKTEEKVKRKKLSRIENYQKHRNFIKGFCCLNKHQKKEVQKNLDRGQVEFIGSVVFCLLNRFLKIDETSKNKLRKYKKKLRSLTANKNYNRKRKILIKGGFLSALLSILASSIVPSAIELILKKVSNDAEKKNENS